MSRFAASFATGLLSGGMREYIRQEGAKREDEKDAMLKEAFGWKREEQNRERTKNAAVDAAMDERNGLLKTGEVIEMPKMSSEMGPPPEAAPDGAGTALQMPTTRKATIADHLGAEMKIAQANRDMTSFARLGRERQQAVDAEGDMAYAKDVMDNPTGEAATNLLRSVYKKTDAFSVRRDPKTGLATLDVFSPAGDFERSVQLAPAQMGQLAIAYRKLGRNDPSSLGEMAAIDKGVAEAAAAEWRTKLAMVKTNNDVVKSGATIANDATRTNLAVNADARAADEAADKRGDRTREIATTLAKQSAAVGLAQERDPNASPAHIEAVRTGVIDAVPKAGGWKFESSDINAMLGTPATSPSGRPILDANGRQVFNTESARVQQLMQFMQQRGIRDTNEALPQFIVWEAERKRAGADSSTPRSSLATPQVGQIVSGFAFKGGDPRDRRNWQPAAAGKVQ